MATVISSAVLMGITDMVMMLEGGGGDGDLEAQRPSARAAGYANLKIVQLCFKR